MARRVNKCLADALGKPESIGIMADRLHEIKNVLRKVSGVMRKMTPDRMKINPEHHCKLLEGWGKHIARLANEITIIESALLASHT